MRIKRSGMPVVPHAHRGRVMDAMRMPLFSDLAHLVRYFQFWAIEDGRQVLVALPAQLDMIFDEHGVRKAHFVQSCGLTVNADLRAVQCTSDHLSFTFDIGSAHLAVWLTEPL